MGNDIRQALRGLSKDRAFALMVVLSLAVGIGANTAIFSMVNGVLLRPLEYRDPGRLVAITQSAPRLLKDYPMLPINLAQWQDWREHAASFENIGVFVSSAFNITGEGEPERVTGATVSANLFSLLGVQPRLGRSFLESEDRAGNDHVVVLADSFWRRRFHADSGIIGRKILVDGRPYEVAGVLPPSFTFPRLGEFKQGAVRPMEMYKPLGYDKGDMEMGFHDFNYSVIARLRPGVAVARANAELNVVQAALVAKAKVDTELRADVAGLQERIVGGSRRGLLMLMVAVGVVLLVLCVNLANLSLARAAGRMRDSAIRAAMGASRWRLVRYSLVETGIWALTGGALGLLLAYWGLRVLVAAAPVDLPRLNEVRLDAGVLFFAFAISAVTGLLAGILPAWRSASSRHPFETLKSGSRANTEGRGGKRVRNGLVSLEVGLSAVLLVTAGLLISSFVRLMNVDKGFDTHRVLTMSLSLPPARYPKEPQRAQALQRVLDQVRVLPGVQSASIVSALPLQGETWIDIVQAEHDTRPPAQFPSTNVRFISPSYFETIGVRMLQGRDFQEGDRNRKVVIISAGLARKLWPDSSEALNPVGRKVNDFGTMLEVAGVTPDLRSTSLDHEPVNMLYVPFWQRPRFAASLFVRTAMEPESVAGAVRKAIWSIDSEVPVPEVKTLEQVMEQSVAQRRFQMQLVLLFAASALALAAFGTYGVVSYAVTRRRSEMGIRMALGAGRAELLKMVFGQGMLPVAAGLAAGGIVALWIGQYVASLLFQVSPRDPVAFCVAGAVLLAVSAAACLVPARRATRVDPIEALRFE